MGRLRGGGGAAILLVGVGAGKEDAKNKRTYQKFWRIEGTKGVGPLDVAYSRDWWAKDHEGMEMIRVCQTQIWGERAREDAEKETSPREIKLGPGVGFAKKPLEKKVLKGPWKGGRALK